MTRDNLEQRDKPAAVPLIEQLRSVPMDAVLRIDTPNALGCMDTRSIPVGRLCREAADAIDAERERCAQICDQINSESGGGFEPFAAAIRKVTP